MELVNEIVLILAHRVSKTKRQTNSKSIVFKFCFFRVLLVVVATGNTTKFVTADNVMASGPLQNLIITCLLARKRAVFDNFTTL